MTRLDKLISELKNPRTWERVDYLCRWKGWEEGKDARHQKPEDKIPFAITITIALFLVYFSLAIAVFAITNLADAVLIVAIMFFFFVLVGAGLIASLEG